MEVTPQLLNEQEFREARRGYDMRDVDDFLERVAVGVARLQERLQDAQNRIEAAEARARQLQEEAAEARSHTSTTAETDETLRRTLVLAQKTADSVVSEAEQTAARIVANAEEQAQFALDEARQIGQRTIQEAEARGRHVGDEARRRVLEEVTGLEAAREALNADVRALRRYLDDQRTRLRTAARDLQRLAEDPTALREVDPPAMSEIDVAALRGDVGAGDGADVPTDADTPVFAEVADSGDDDLEAAFVDWPPEPDTEPEPDSSEQPAGSVPFDDLDDLDDRDDEFDEPAPPASASTGDADDLRTPPGDDDDADYFEDLRRAMNEPDDDGLDDEDDVPDDLEAMDDEPPGRSRFGWRR